MLGVAADENTHRPMAPGLELFPAGCISMGKEKASHGKRETHAQRADRPKVKLREFATTPPRKRPWLLAISSVLIVAWIVFLAVMAFRH